MQITRLLLLSGAIGCALHRRRRRHPHHTHIIVCVCMYTKHAWMLLLLLNASHTSASTHASEHSITVCKQNKRSQHSLCMYAYARGESARRESESIFLSGYPALPSPKMFAHRSAACQIYTVHTSRMNAMHLACLLMPNYFCWLPGCDSYWISDLCWFSVRRALFEATRCTTQLPPLPPQPLSCLALRVASHSGADRSRALHNCSITRTDQTMTATSRSARTHASNASRALTQIQT